jgi:chemosensory pili system protein ChpA (sensor histidine kinase/response regulator)
MATILIVDDELIIREMIAALVEDMGYTAVTASDGRGALELLDGARRPPALVITDLMMPLVNGATLARELKASARYRHVPIVLMSAACHSRHATAADHFLAKPFALQDIERYIERYVAGWPGTSASDGARQHAGAPQLEARTRG